MQKKGKIMVVGIIVIVLVIVAMITAKKQDYKTEVSGPDDVIIDDLVYREVTHEDPKAVFANYENSLNEADNILVEKVIRTSIEGANGEYSTSCQMLTLLKNQMIQKILQWQFLQRNMMIA